VTVLALAGWLVFTGYVLAVAADTPGWSGHGSQAWSCSAWHVSPKLGNRNGLRWPSGRQRCSRVLPSPASC